MFWFGLFRGVRLWHLIFLGRIIAYCGRLNRVVAWVASLQAMAHVNTGALATFRDGHGAWPPQRFEHVDCEADVLTLPTICICILLCVANYSADPAGLLTWEGRMLTDVAEPLDGGIFLL